MLPNKEQIKVLILGSSGFVGRNIAEVLSEKFIVIKTTRKRDRGNAENKIYFDLFDQNSWINVINASPDVVVNAAAYGVVKLQTDFDIMYKTNYFLAANLFDYIYRHANQPYWLQLGTAFEYDLSSKHITENSPCLPKTHYGISKLMMSNYLLANGKSGNYSIIRPFGMFGKYEDESKFFPFLINAQKKNVPVELSPGTQKRDYIFVNDLARFINKLLKEKKLSTLPDVLNIGCGKAISFREYATILQAVLPSFNPDLWQWGKLNFRADESDMFYSGSGKAIKYGFSESTLEKAFSETSEYYFSK